MIKHQRIQNDYKGEIQFAGFAGYFRMFLDIFGYFFCETLQGLEVVINGFLLNMFQILEMFQIYFKSSFTIHSSHHKLVLYQSTSFYLLITRNWNLRLFLEFFLCCGQKLEFFSLLVNQRNSPFSFFLVFQTKILEFEIKNQKFKKL